MPANPAHWADRYCSLPKIVLASLVIAIVIMMTERPKTEVEFILTFSETNVRAQLISERTKKTTSIEQLEFVSANHPTLYRNGGKVTVTRDVSGKIEIILEGYREPDEQAMKLFCWTMAQFALDASERLKKDIHFGRRSDGIFRYITYKADPPEE